MKINIAENSINAEELKTKLAAKFPNYKVFIRQKNIVVVQKTGIIGTTCLIRKKNLIINGNFPTIIGSMLFMFSVILLGILIPLIVYFAAFHGKMKTVEKEVVAYLQGEYPPAAR